MKAVILAGWLALLASPAPAQTAAVPSVAVQGPGGQTATVTAADLDGMARQTVTLQSHGVKHQYQGALLSDVLAEVGAPRGATLHGAAMADVVVVKGADGYQVAFGLADADPATVPNRIILADRMDGAALIANDAPFRLVVEGDLEAKRSVRMVTSVEVVRLGGPSR